MQTRIILVVDDQPDNLLTMQQIIAAYLPECRAVTAGNAADGLALAASQPVDLCVLDVQMPAMDGIEMCRRLHAAEATPHVPVVLLSAHRADPDLRAAGLDAGAEEFFSKPIDNVELSARLRAILRLKQAKDELPAVRPHIEVVEERTADLAESERNFRLLVENAPTAIFIQTQGRMAFANPAAVALFGATSAEELLGRPAVDLVHPDFHAAVLHRMHVLNDKRTPIPSAEMRYLRVDATPVDVEVSATPFRYQGCDGALLFARDVTGRKQVVQQLEMLKHSIDVHHDGAYWMDTENRFVYVNDAGCQALGYSREELLGRPLSDVNPAATPQAMEHVWEQLRRDDSYSGETVHHRRDGSVFPVEIMSTYVRFGDRELNCGFARDITDRKRAEEDLRRSATALQKAQSVAHVGSWVWHIGTDRLEWSDEMYRIFGIDRETFSGDLAEVIARAIHPEDRAAVEQSNRMVIEKGEPVPLEYRVVRPDGTVRVVWAEAGDLLGGPSGDPAILTGTVQDITERKRAEVLLRARAELAEMAQHSTLDELLQVALDKAELLTGSCIGFAHFVDPDQEHLRLQTWSTNTMERMCTAEGKGRHYPVSEAGVWADCLRTGTTVIHNNYASLPHRKGLPEGHAQIVREMAVPIKSEGLVACIMGVGNKATDYTEEDARALEVLAGVVVDHAVSRRAMDALHESEERLRLRNATLNAIFENAPYIMMTVDAGGRVVDVNRAGAAFAGRARENLRGLLAGEVARCLNSLNELGCGRGPSCGDCPIRVRAERTLATGEAIHNAEGTMTVVHHGQGEPFHFLISTSPLAGPEDSLALITIVDVTEKRRAEDALRESNARLEETLRELKATQSRIVQQERLRAVGEMASGIAHDFNNALTPILAYSDVVLAHPEVLDQREKVLGYMRALRTAAEDAQQVVSRLREFYRHREGVEVRRPIHLNEVVEQAIDLCRPKWRDQAMASGVTIRVDRDLQPVPLLFGDEHEVREALTNLILNAADAIIEKTEGRTGEDAREGTITIRTRQIVGGDQDRRAALSVTDTGIGMAETTRRSCLEPFYTTKGDRGTGLGLAMVYGIVQRHEGSIEIESVWGRGTTFTLLLPAREPQLGQSETPAHRETASPLHILVVDDEPLVRSATVVCLEAFGHTAVAADDGAEALDHLMSERFDVVITDRAMPGMNGDQLARAIRKLVPQQPVILLTGFGDMMESAGEKPDGVDLVVSKPVSLAVLRKALAMVTAG